MSCGSRRIHIYHLSELILYSYYSEFVSTSSTAGTCPHRAFLRGAGVSGIVCALGVLDRSLYLLVTPADLVEVLSEDSEQLVVDAAESSGALFVLLCCIIFGSPNSNF